MKRNTKTSIVMLIDSWFPGQDGRPGVFGGSQVHVRQLRHLLEQKYSYRIKLYYSAHPNWLVRQCWWLLVMYQVWRYARFHPVDIIHAHGLLSAISGKIVSIVLKKPLVVTVHTTHYFEWSNNPIKAWLAWRLYTKTHYHALITVAKSFLTYPNVNSTIHYIHNGVDIGRYTKVRVTKNVRPTLIWVGREHAAKGIDILKKAIVKIRKIIPDLQAELVTGGRLTDLDLIKAYKRAHVFVLPSLAEGQPISLLEAWAAKLPVVATGTGDVSRLVKHGVNGFLVEPGNVKQLANATIKVLRARVNHKRMAQAGFKLVKKRFSWELTAQKTHQVYQSLLQ